MSLVILGAWFPANALYHQHSNLASAEAQLSVLHQQDAALAQERKNLSDSGEISRIAREQYQLVSPGQQAFEVLPQTGSSQVGGALLGRSRAERARWPRRRPPSSRRVRGPRTTQPAKAHRAVAAPDASNAQPAAPPRGVVGRMLDALEFWR